MPVVNRFAEASRSIGGCGGAERIAAEFQGEVISNDAVKMRDLPPVLQQIMMPMTIGQATQPVGSIEDTVRVFVICGRDEANAAREPVIRTSFRDVDVPLSPLGERQATALGHWFGALPRNQRPTVVITSPYVRARQTTAIIKQLGDFPYASDVTSLVVDERFREKEFGILDGLTRYGILERFPDQAAFRTSPSRSSTRRSP